MICSSSYFKENNKSTFIFRKETLVLKYFMIKSREKKTVRISLRQFRMMMQKKGSVAKKFNVYKKKIINIIRGW